jgi:hypothetical protein
MNTDNLADISLLDRHQGVQSCLSRPLRLASASVKRTRAEVLHIPMPTNARDDAEPRNASEARAAEAPKQFILPRRLAMHAQDTSRNRTVNTPTVSTHQRTPCL